MIRFLVLNLWFKMLSKIYLYGNSGDDFINFTDEGFIRNIKDSLEIQ